MLAVYYHQRYIKGVAGAVPALKKESKMQKFTMAQLLEAATNGVNTLATTHDLQDIECKVIDQQLFTTAIYHCEGVPLFTVQVATGSDVLSLHLAPHYLHSLTNEAYDQIDCYVTNNPTSVAIRVRELAAASGLVCNWLKPFLVING